MLRCRPTELLARTAVLLVMALFVGGCTPFREYIRNGFKVGPNYERPPAPVAADWIEQDGVRRDSADLSAWWMVFDDPVLNALTETAYQQNLTLREAGMRVLRSRAQLGVAVGGIFPQFQVANGGFTQRGISLEVANRFAGLERYFGQWDYGFAVAWELDFWGKFRRAIEAADASLQASVENYDFLLVTLLGDVAANYVELRALEQQLAYLKTNVKLQRETVRIAEARFKSGEVAELDVDQAKSLLARTEADIPQVQISIRQVTNRLCVLLGTPPEDLELGAGSIPVAPMEVVVGIPAELIRRRPDVRREERIVAERSAKIGLAESDLYPAISISGQFGFSAEDLSDLWNAKAFRGSIGPSFQWNILNYGRILNNIRAQQAGLGEQIAKYQNTVLRAAEEVENGLVIFVRARERTAYLAASVEAASSGVRAALAKYKNGLINFNRVALLEQDLVRQQTLLAEAKGEIALGLIQVYRALGGGWQIRLREPELVLPPLKVPPSRPLATLGQPVAVDPNLAPGVAVETEEVGPGE